MYGKTHMGIERTTFVIDENGRVAKVFPKVKVAGPCRRGARGGARGVRPPGFLR